MEDLNLEKKYTEADLKRAFEEGRIPKYMLANGGVIHKYATFEDWLNGKETTDEDLFGRKNKNSSKG